MKNLKLAWILLLPLFCCSCALPFFGGMSSDDSAVLTIYVTRHAQRGNRKFWPEADRNAVTRGEMLNGKLVRPKEDSITPTGEKQCRVLGKYLQKKGFRGKIIASPMFRTMQTAVITAESCDPSLKVTPDPRLQNVSGRKGKNGKGMSCAELEKRFSGKIVPVQYPEYFLIANEKPAMRPGRLSPVVDELIRNRVRGEVLLVSHSSAIPYLVAALNRYGTPETVLKYYHKNCLNCSLFVFRFNGKGKLISSATETMLYMPPELQTSNLTVKKR